MRSEKEIRDRIEDVKRDYPEAYSVEVEILEWVLEEPEEGEQ